MTINTDMEDDLVFVKEERSVFRTELPLQDQVHESSLEGMYRSIFLNEAEAKLGRFERNYLAGRMRIYEYSPPPPRTRN